VKPVSDIWKDAPKQDQVVQAPAAKRRAHGDGTLRRVVWGAIFIYAGLVLLADQTGYLPASREAGWWEWIMLGAGGLFLLEALIRVVSVDLHGPSLGRLILGVVLLVLGSSAVFGVTIPMSWWPVVPILIGLSLLFRGLMR
jgi:hypothetical protein